MNVGSYNDPPHRQGMAHFLEHMIFMGSQKYKEEAAYSEHVSANGGYCNAYTEFELTNFQFNVQYSGLQKALDMAANNFASPLLCKEAMEREINAVESEFKGVVTDDNLRLIEIVKKTLQSDKHIFTTFAWGNLKSLVEDEDMDALWDDLQKFYDEYYSADRMKLVI